MAVRISLNVSKESSIAYYPDVPGAWQLRCFKPKDPGHCPGEMVRVHALGSLGSTLGVGESLYSSVPQQIVLEAAPFEIPCFKTKRPPN
jgi:hypothetical protein